MIKPEVLDALVAAGATAEMVAAAIKADQKTAGAIRQARYRERHKSSLAVTERNEASLVAIPPNEMSPIPPKNITPTPSSELRSSSGGTPARKTKIRSQISEDEQLVEADLEFARKAGMDSRRIDEEWAQFRDYHRSRGNLMADWHGAWRTWVRNCGKFDPTALTPQLKLVPPADPMASYAANWRKEGHSEERITARLKLLKERAIG